MLAYEAGRSRPDPWDKRDGRDAVYQRHLFGHIFNNLNYLIKASSSGPSGEGDGKGPWHGPVQRNDRKLLRRSSLSSLRPLIAFVVSIVVVVLFVVIAMLLLLMAAAAFAAFVVSFVVVVIIVIVVVVRIVFIAAEIKDPAIVSAT